MSGPLPASADAAPPVPGGDPWLRRLVWSSFVAGLLLSAIMAARSQLGGDQLSLLARGWLLAERGELLPYGNPLSGGGHGPGAATSVFVGLPLAIWSHHRAPVVAIWLLHGVAWMLLDRRLRGVLGPGERAAFAVVYWLSPWRMSAASMLWNPNYGFLLGAIHFATVFDQRETPRFWPSFTHVLALGVASQLHPSALLLIVASLFLALTRTVRVHWPGAIAGAAVTLLTLVPWLQALRERPELFRGDGGHPFHALLLVQPWIKGLSLWFRYPSLFAGTESLRLDFSAALGAADAWLTPLARGFVIVAGCVTMFAALAANVEHFREGWRRDLLRSGPAADARELVRRYVAACAVAAIVVFAASPTTPQSWQGYPLFHVAALPVAFWLGRRLESSAAAAALRARRGLAAWAAAAVTVSLFLAFGAPAYRCGGRHEMRLALASDSPMLEDLGIQETCHFPTRVPGGWWPDGLPRE